MVGAISKTIANVFVVVPRNVPDYTNAIRALCRHVYVVDYEWWRHGEPQSLAAIETFKAIIAENRIGFVHVNTIMLREPLEAAKACGVDGVVHARELIQHDPALQKLIGLPAQEIIEETKRRADWIIGNSHVTADSFRTDGRTFTIQNTIDVDAMDMENVISPNEIRFGLISSNIAKKGLSDVVDLARMAVTRAKKAKFVIINLPFKQITVKKLTVKKKTVMAIYADETGGDRMTSATFWDGKKYRYQPIGSSME